MSVSAHVGIRNFNDGRCVENSIAESGDCGGSSAAASMFCFDDWFGLIPCTASEMRGLRS